MLYAPPGIFVGPEALDKFAGDLRATHPDSVYTPHGEAQALHSAGRLAWGSGPRGEPPNYTDPMRVDSGLLSEAEWSCSTHPLGDDDAGS